MFSFSSIFIFLLTSFSMRNCCSRMRKFELLRSCLCSANRLDLAPSYGLKVSWLNSSSSLYFRSSSRLASLRRLASARSPARMYIGSWRILWDYALILGAFLVWDNSVSIRSMRIFSSFIFFVPAWSNKRLTALSNCISVYWERACDRINLSSIGSVKSFIVGTPLWFII